MSHEPVVDDVRTIEGFRACVDLQRTVFGYADADLVPKNELVAASESGGLVLGARVGEETVGFCFGLPAFRREDGTWRRYHASRMLAVHPDHRGRGLARRLKLAQRTRCLDQDLDLVEWTYDPLASANAHINLHRLGAVGRAYRRDLYGRSASPLHGNVPTDRLLCAWAIDREPRPPEPVQDGEDLHRVNEVAAGDGPPRPGSLAPPPADGPCTLAIPRDTRTIRARPDLFAAWRTHVRQGMEALFDTGRVAVDYLGDGGDGGDGEDGDLGRYVFARRSPSPPGEPAVG